jgi:transcriptional regulator with XRE-family HTH domain
MMTPEQCRMARAGLSIGVRELAEAARVSIGTVSRFEAGQGVPDMTVGLFQKALERAGAEFVAEGADAGVWLRRSRNNDGSIPLEQLSAENDE